MNIHQHRTNTDAYSILPLSTWLNIMNTQASYNVLATTNPALVAEAATLKQWFSLTKNVKNGCPNDKIAATTTGSQQQERTQMETWQTRLHVAIAITKMLCDLHDGIMSRGYSKKFSVENIVLDMSRASSSCYSATLKPSSDGSVVECTRESDMEHLGCILNAVFGGGDNDDSIGVNKEEQHKSEDDSTRKKRGKQQDHQQQSMENLPLYLSCIVSSLTMTSTNETTEDKETGPSSADKETGPSSAASSTIISHASFSDEQYANVKQVLHDLQTASAKPEVYLKRGRSSWNDGKNTRLHIPPDFYGRKSELSLLLHSLGTVLRFGQPVMVSVSGYAGTG